jgi:broad specificity phosphatase PhoE
MRLLLVPHAQTDLTDSHQVFGWTDTLLNERGRQEAALVARRLRGQRIDACHASDLRRATQTAAAICEPRGLVVTTEPRLRELNFGDWEGMTYPEMCHADYSIAHALHTDPLNTAPPGGETLGQLTERAAAFLTEVTETVRLHDRRVLVVAHRGSLRVMLCLLLNLPPRLWWEFFLTPASVSELDLYSEGAVLNLLNDTHHLREVGHAG